MGKETNFYAVHRGVKPGVYETWTLCKAQVEGFTGARYKKFSTKAEAESFVKLGKAVDKVKSVTIKKTKKENEFSKSVAEKILSAQSSKPSKTKKDAMSASSKADSIDKEDLEPSYTSSFIPTSGGPIDKDSIEIIYTDGSSRGNGKKGARAGVGVFFGTGDSRNVSERLPGPKQTNQRAELMAAIRALEKASPKKIIEIHTDSKYLVRGITEWVPSWLKKGWVTSAGTAVENKDLFETLFKHVNERKEKVRWVHVPAHSGILGNEMADQLAVAGASLDTSE